MTSTLVLIGIYLLVTVASQAFAGTEYLKQQRRRHLRRGLAKGVLGPLHFLLTIAVLTSATAATQTTILPAARQALSMGRRDAIPRRFAEIHPKLLPGRDDLGRRAVGHLVRRDQKLSSDVLADCVAGLGFLVCIYYGFTGFACTIFYRHELGVGAELRQLALLPTLGGLALMGILG